MRRLISIIFALTLPWIIACGGSGRIADNQEPILLSYTNIQPSAGLNEDKGTGEDSEDQFTPHTLFTNDAVTDDNNKPGEIQNSGLLYDLGLVIEESDGSGSPRISDPLLASIRQDIESQSSDGSMMTSEEGAGLMRKIDMIENDFKGDLAALRSENLMLLNRIKKLEGKSGVKTKLTSKPAVKKKSPPKSVTKKAAAKKPAAKKPELINAFNYKANYDKALAAYRNRKFAEAIKKFKILINADKSHDLADNAQYWTGECFYHLKNYARAVVEFKKVLNYKNSNKQDAALLMTGKAYKHLGMKPRAIEYFDRLNASYPNSVHSKRANQLIAELKRSG